MWWNSSFLGWNGKPYLGRPCRREEKEMIRGWFLIFYPCQRCQDVSSPVVRCAEVCMKNTAAKSVTESPHLSAFAEQADLLVCMCVWRTERARVQVKPEGSQQDVCAGLWPLTVVRAFAVSIPSSLPPQHHPLFSERQDSDGLAPSAMTLQQQHFLI